MNAPDILVASRDSMTLAPGQRLGDFLITRVVGQGGFGIVYEAEDLKLQRRVAIKEYMPSQLAARTDGTVNPVSDRYAKTFELGRRSFLAEARLLAQFRHPGLLEVLHFWEQNGTAYMVMPFYEGRTLDQVLANGPRVVNEAWLKAVIRPVLDALEHMHGEDCYHRDVSADNILIRNDGKALLLDLGAARRVIGESDRALTVMLKPGYAPIEQYADDPQCRQGPWTDIYAVAAVLYFAVTNRMPPASASRLMHDSLPSLAALAPPGYSRRFLEAIDRGLSIRPEQRPGTVGEFRSLLFAASPEDGIAGGDASPEDGAPSRSAAASKRAGADQAPGAAAGSARSADSSPRTPADSRVPAAAPRAPLAWAAGIVAVALVAAGAWLALGGEGEAASPASIAAAAAAAASSPASRAGTAGDSSGAAAAGISGSPRPSEMPASAAGGSPAAIGSAPGVRSDVSVASGDAASISSGATGISNDVPVPSGDVPVASGGASDAPHAASVAERLLGTTAGSSVSAPQAASQTGPPQAASSTAPSASIVAGTLARSTEAASAPAAAAPTGTVRLAVSPWGEVFVDGVSRGVTPPLKQLKLDAGPHRIEIRNPAGPTLARQIDVVAGQRTTITHRFP